jgi:hypothetical protein
MPALKYSKSIGFPAKIVKNDLLSNTKFSEVLNEIPKMASNSFFPDESFSKNENKVGKKINLISYEEFETGINSDLSKQSATSEILSILSNSKKNKFDCDYINVNKNHCNNKVNDNNSNKNSFQTQTNFKKNEFSVQNCKNNSPIKNYKLVVNNDNPINFNANVEKNNNVKNNFLKNTNINCLEKNYNKNISFSKIDEKVNNFNEILNCIENAEMENVLDFQDSNFDKNLFANVQQKLSFNIDLSNKNQNLKDHIFPILINKDKKKELSPININKNENQKNPFEELNYLDIKNFNENNILYFLEENFFLELEKENYDITNYTSSLNCSLGKYDNFNNQLRKTTSTPVPIRCTNPFEKSLSVEGCSKIQRFFAEEIEKNTMHLKKEELKHYNSKPDFVEKFMFSEPQTLKVRK